MAKDPNLIIFLGGEGVGEVAGAGGASVSEFF